MKEFLATIAVLVIFAGLTLFLFPAMGLYQIEHWGVKYEDANRKVFEHSKSYVHGNIRDLENLKLAYIQAKTPEEKAAILDVAHHRAADFDSADLPPDLQLFIRQQ